MPSQIYNLHTHTHRCRHAVGDVEDYVRVARAGGCMTLGMSDHTPHPKGDVPNSLPHAPGGRMAVSEFPSYKAAVLAARIAHPDMHIPLGLECEWSPELRQFYLDLDCDYLVGSVHVFDPTWTIDTYTDHVVDTIEAGIFVFLAHPDQFWFSPRQWSDHVDRCAERICIAAAARKVPLELNGNRIWDASGPAGTWPFFWDMARRHGCQVVINSDAHDPRNTLQNYERMAAIRDHYGLVEVQLEIPCRN